MTWEEQEVKVGGGLEIIVGLEDSMEETPKSIEEKDGKTWSKKKSSWEGFWHISLNRKMFS